MDTRLAASWQRLWAGLGAAGDGQALYETLCARHAEPWRHYHTLQHLGECIAHFGSASHLAQRPAEVEVALWFHDAVYDLQRHDNEEQSAALASRELAAAGVPPEAVARVAALVLATRHMLADAAPPTGDTQLLVDIDLAILGAAPPRFAEYERQIREEYASVPEAAFRARRRGVLQSFLARPALYSTGHFRTRLQAQARANLAQALQAC